MPTSAPFPLSLLWDFDLHLIYRHRKDIQQKNPLLRKKHRCLYGGGGVSETVHFQCKWDFANYVLLPSFCLNCCKSNVWSAATPQLTSQLWVVVIDNDDAGRLMDCIASWIPCNSIRPLRHPPGTPGSAALQLLKAGFPKVLNSQKHQWQTNLRSNPKTDRDGLHKVCLIKY